MEHSEVQRLPRSAHGPLPKSVPMAGGASESMRGGAAPAARTRPSDRFGAYGPQAKTRLGCPSRPLPCMYRTSQARTLICSRRASLAISHRCVADSPLPIPPGHRFRSEHLLALLVKRFVRRPAPPIRPGRRPGLETRQQQEALSGQTANQRRASESGVLYRGALCRDREQRHSPASPHLGRTGPSHRRWNGKIVYAPNA